MSAFYGMSLKFSQCIFFKFTAILIEDEFFTFSRQPLMILRVHRLEKEEFYWCSTGSTVIFEGEITYFGYKVFIVLTTESDHFVSGHD